MESILGSIRIADVEYSHDNQGSTRQIILYFRRFLKPDLLIFYLSHHQL